MTNKQTSWVLFGFSLVISFVFLSVLIKTNYDLDQMRRAIVDQNKQIDGLKKTIDDLYQKDLEVSKNLSQINRDIDTVQDLQRKQAQVVVDLRKSKKH